MWIMTKIGFFSIVKRPEGFHVRARTERDIQNIVELLGVQRYDEDSKADYRYRVIVSKVDIDGLMRNLGRMIDYRNFKAEIHATPDQVDKSDAYAQIWGIMHRYGLEQGRLEPDPNQLDIFGSDGRRFMSDEEYSQLTPGELNDLDS